MNNMPMRLPFLVLGWAVLLAQSATARRPEPTLRLAGEPGRSLFLPLEARHGLFRARGLLRNGTLAVHGAVREGYFYTRLMLGTPAKPFTVIIDTGSTITYVPCSTCKACGAHTDRPFDISASSTAVEVTCSMPECFCGSPACRCPTPSSKCFYTRRYAEQSSSQGFLVRDAFRFPDEAAAGIPVVFGCVDSETGQIYDQAADGILGMGNNRNALHSQLAESGQMSHVFSLCFGFPSGGGMLLGEVGLPPNMVMAYTPLLEDRHMHYFNVRLEAVSVAGAELPVMADVYSSGYGCVMDSGTTFTYLPGPAFSALTKALANALATKRVKRVPGPDPSYPDVCWGDAPRDWDDMGSLFPTLEMRFAGGATLQLPPFRYLFQLREREYCLGVFDNGEEGALIGGIAVRNVLVQYDVAGQRVGFAEADCPGIGSAAPAHTVAAARAPPLPQAAAGAQQRQQSQPAASPGPAPQQPQPKQQQQQPAAASAQASPGGSSASQQQQQQQQREPGADEQAASQPEGPAPQQSHRGSQPTEQPQPGEQQQASSPAIAEELSVSAAGGDVSDARPSQLLTEEQWMGALRTAVAVVGATVTVLLLAGAVFAAREPLGNAVRRVFGRFQPLAQDCEMADLQDAQQLLPPGAQQDMSHQAGLNGHAKQRPAADGGLREGANAGGASAPPPTDGAVPVFTLADDER